MADPLFHSKAVRDYQQSDSRFLNIAKEQELKIIGIDYSRRPDNFLADFNGTRGFIFDNHIDPWPYVLFLEKCLEENVPLFRVQHNDDPNQPNRFVEEVECFPDLYMKYKVSSGKIDYPLSEKVESMMSKHESSHAQHSHGHSHGDHSHSHSHSDHSHSHEGHSHVHPTAAPAENVPIEKPETLSPLSEKIDVKKPESEPPTAGHSHSHSHDTSLRDHSHQSNPRIRSAEVPVEEPEAEKVEITKPKNEASQAEASNSHRPLNVHSREGHYHVHSTDVPGENNPVAVEEPKPNILNSLPEKIEVGTSNDKSHGGLPDEEQSHIHSAGEAVKKDAVVKPNEEIEIVKSDHEAMAAVPSSSQPYNEPTPVVVPNDNNLVDEMELRVTTPPLDEVAKISEEEVPTPSKNNPFEESNEKLFANDVYTEKNETVEQNLNALDGYFVRSTARKILTGLRLYIQPLDYFDDTGIFVFIYLMTAILIYLTRFALSDSKCPDVVDRRALYDAQTMIQEQKIELQELRRNAPSEAQMAQQNELKRLCDVQKNEIDVLRLKITDPEVLAEYERKVCELQSSVSALTEEKKALNESLHLMTEAKNSAECCLADTVKNNNEKLARLAEDSESNLKEANAAKNEIVLITTKLSEQDKKIAELQLALSEKSTYATELKEQYDAVLSIIADQKAAESGGEEAVESGESGASGSGWSDVGNDVDIDGVDGVDKRDEDSNTDQRTVRAKSKPPSVSDLEDLAKARAELLKVSKERDTLRMEQHTMRDAKQALVERIERLERDIALENERAARVQREYDDQREQAKGLFQMDQKLSLIQAELSSVQAEFSNLKDTLFKVESKARDLENERQHSAKLLESLRENESRLRNQWFHEEKKFSNRIRELEQTVVKLQSSIPSTNTAVEVMSPSTNRELLGDVPSLWSPFANTSGDASLDESDISRSEQRRRSIREPPSSSLLRAHTGSSSGLNVVLPRYSNRDSFSGNRDESDTVPSVRGTAGRRMRSRSAGRLNRENRVDGDSAGYTSGRRSVHRPGHISPATSLLLHSGTNRNSDRENDGRSSDGAYPR